MVDLPAEIRARILGMIDRRFEHAAELIERVPDAWPAGEVITLGAGGLMQYFLQGRVDVVDGQVWFEGYHVSRWDDEGELFHVTEDGTFISSRDLFGPCPDEPWEARVAWSLRWDEHLRGRGFSRP